MVLIEPVLSSDTEEDISWSNFFLSIGFTSFGTATGMSLGINPLKEKISHGV